MSPAEDARANATTADATSGVADVVEGLKAAASTPPTGTLYMCRFSNNSGIYTLNVTNGTPKLLGALGVNQTCTDLAFRKTAASGTQLFGTSFTRLFSINTATGHATLKSSAYGSAITDINALVAQPGTGTLYGAGSRVPGEFVEINPTSGTAKKVGSLGTGIGSAGDLEFFKGQLYGLVVKSSTGSQTYLAKISLNAGTLGRATQLLQIRRQISGRYVALSNVWGLANRGGVLYAAMQTGELLTINPGTGIATLKGDNNLNQAGLAVAP